MRVDGSANNKQLEIIALIQAHAQARGPKTGVPSPGTASLSPGHAAETSEAVEPAGGDGDTDDGQRGVIRLLQSGHFHGVADVRLRINFAAELQGIQSADTASLLNNALPDIKQQLNDAIDTFLSSNSLTEEESAVLQAARDAFNNQIDNLLGDGTAQQGDNDVFAELRTAFEDFLNGLLPPQESDSQSIISVDVTAEVSATSDIATGTPPVDATGDSSATGDTASTTDIFAALRDSLTKIFEDAISGLQDSVNALGLPPLSEPSGNGRAYEKFLATYNELYGVGGTGTNGGPETAGTTDTTPLDEGFEAIS